MGESELSFLMPLKSVCVICRSRTYHGSIAFCRGKNYGIGFIPPLLPPNHLAEDISAEHLRHSAGYEVGDGQAPNAAQEFCLQYRTLTKMYDYQLLPHSGVV